MCASGRSIYLSRVVIKGFRGIPNKISIRLAPLTIIFGPNTSGKTSVAEALYSTLRATFSGQEPLGKPV